MDGDVMELTEREREVMRAALFYAWQEEVDPADYDPVIAVMDGSSKSIARDLYFRLGERVKP